MDNKYLDINGLDYFKNKFERKLESKMNTVVEDYLKENPVETGATQEQVEQIEKNSSDISELKGDIGDLDSTVFYENQTSVTLDWGIKNGYIRFDNTVDSVGYSNYRHAVLPVIPGDVYICTGASIAGHPMLMFRNDADEKIESYPVVNPGSALITYEDVKITVPIGATKVLFNDYKAWQNVDCHAMKVDKLSKIDKIEEIVDKIDADNGIVSLVVNGNLLTFSSKDENGNTWGMTANLVTADKNNQYNINKFTLNGTEFKNSGDDVAPINFRGFTGDNGYISGGYIAANHGFDRGRRLTASHDKTESDIGSVWKDSVGNKYVIFGVYNNYIDILSGTAPKAVSPLTHISGAEHQSDIVFTEFKVQYVFPSINGNTISIFDSNGNKIVGDGEYKSTYFKIVESYNCLNPDAVMTYLKSNVGNCTNASIADINISPMCRINYVREIHRGCSYTVYQSLDATMDFELNFAGFLQSQPIGKFCYVPGFNGSEVFELKGSDVYMPNTGWDNADNPPYRYYQFQNENLDRGFMLGFYPKIADAVPSERKIKCTNAGFYYGSTNKMYPYLVNAKPLVSGETVEAIGFRTPFLKSTNGSLATVYNYIGDDIILCIDYQKSSDTVITLRGECVGKRIEILDKTDSCVFNRRIASSDKLPIKFTDKGYVVLRFFN